MMNKRISAFLLAAMMMLSLMPAMAYAADVEIGTLAELKAFRNSVNAGDDYSGKTIILTADIDLEQEDWIAIGTSTYPFSGTFDGQGHTISNLWTYETGLFGYTSTGNYGDNYGKRAIIKNFTLNNATVIHSGASDGTAAVIGQAYQNTVVDSVNLTGEILVSGYRFVGGIVGQGYVQINNCHVDGGSEENSKISASYWAVGGIVGYAGNEGGSSIKNCSVKNVALHSASGGVSAIAGVGTTGPIENVTAESVVITGADYYNGFLSGFCGTVTGDSWAKDVEISTPVYDAVAEAGGVVYFDLASALTNGIGKTIVLHRSASLSGDVTIDRDTTLVLGGNTLTCGDYGFVVSGGTLTCDVNTLPITAADGQTLVTGGEAGAYTYGVPAPVYGGPAMNWVKVNSGDNGVVKSGPLAASEGATITLYPKAAAGYVLDTVEVLDAEGNAIQLNGLKFRVPLGGVTVNATFKPAQ